MGRRARRSRDGRGGGLAREELVDVSERLELERVAERVEQEHRRLLARFALEAHIGLDDEARLCGLEPGGERMPRRHVEHRAEMADRNVLAVDEARGVAHRAAVDLVRDNLVTIEIEVDPGVRAATLGTPQEVAVETARGGEVVDRKCEVESRIGRGGQMGGHGGHFTVCQGKWSRSTLPPLTMMPTRAPAMAYAPSSTHASGTAPDGSTTIFIRSQMMRIARTMDSSLQVAMSSTYARIAPNVRGASVVRRPSAIVVAGGNGSMWPERKPAAASPALAGSAP